MKKIVFVLSLIHLLFGGSIENMLYKIDLKNDLSNKTKKENSGVLHIFTREDIESLQITHLRDVIKLVSMDYKFNRFGIVDIFNPNTNIPFLSSTIKIFIDNQEIVSGFYNSGLAILGDMDLGWVDHIEIYTQSPSLDVSTEPSIVVIKLYSKKAQRDEGNSIHLSLGSKKSTYDYIESAKTGDYSYYAYFGNDNYVVSRNKNNSKYKRHILLNIYNQTSNFLLDADFLNRDGFLGFSLDGIPDKSYIKNKVVHIGYNKKTGGLNAYIGISFNKTKVFYYKNPLLFLFHKKPFKSVNIYSVDRVIDANLKYKKEFKKNLFLAGIKNRFKYFNYRTLKFDNYNLPQHNRKSQNVHTFFAQESYFLNSHSLVNFGYSFSFFQNSANVKNQKTKLIRAAHTFLKNKWTFKTNFSHIEYTIDPYLINSIFVSRNLLKPVKIDNIFENIKYNYSFKHKFELALGYFIADDYLFIDNQGLLYNMTENIENRYFEFRYDYSYAPFSKFSFNYFFQYMSNIPKINIYRIHKIALFNYNPYKKWRFFEETVIDKSEGRKFYYDLSLGLKYIKNDNVTFFAKGENLLNRAKEYSFFSFNPVTQKFDSPLSVPFIERKITAGMEYLF